MEQNFFVKSDLVVNKYAVVAVSWLHPTLDI